MAAEPTFPRLRARLALALATGALALTATPSPLAAAVPAMAKPALSSPAAVSTASLLQRWPVLRQGPNSAWPQATVRSLQYLLRARGASVAVNGTFGRQTRVGVVAFQRGHHLVADGVVGAQTWRSLIITVRQGSRGDAVRAVQDQINFRNLRNGHTLNVDGIFGPRTRSAVIAFQRALAVSIRPFAVDGIVGPQTWPALVNESLSG